ncbi:MAG: 3-methyl-2-oxobutanoate hydroxymethyltransferase [Clostridia bacterium]|nr:3-methyl-2-oxobutanoate hydroxymethyltransferase [Clostridia bacterium]
MSRVTVQTLRQKKERGERVVMLTAYDYPMARLFDEAGVDVLLVGDSLGMAVLGYDSTLPVTMEDMLRHTAAVARAARRALVVADMPFLSYQSSEDEGVRNAGRLLQVGAQAVKVEGGRSVAGFVARLVAAGIPVVGHIGLTPQSVHQLGGYRLQGREPTAARRLLEDAIALQEAGVAAVVLEMVPPSLARIITRELQVPTIGIGAGPHCDGQVLVAHDVLGLYQGKTPSFVRQYANLAEVIARAAAAYAADVRSGAFPGEGGADLPSAALEVLEGTFSDGRARP